MALVLDVGHGALGIPVDGGGDGREVSGGLEDRVSLDLRAGKAEANVVSPLIERKVGELVVSKGVGEVLGVVLLNDVIIVGEVLEHLYEVLSVLGNKAVLLEPSEEFGLVVGTVVDIASDGDGSLI